MLEEELNHMPKQCVTNMIHIERNIVMNLKCGY